jgi:hypothetical protein
MSNQAEVMRRLDTLLPIPPQHEGSGIYVSTILEGLQSWMASDAKDPNCPQEHDLMWAIVSLADIWRQRDQEGTL